MTKKEFQIKYNLTDEDMAKIEFIVKLFNGKIISIKQKGGGK